MGVSVLITTRSRPKRFRETVESILKTKTGEVEILSYVDENDPKRDEYESPSIIGPRNGLGDAIHRLIEKASCSYMLVGSDDIIFKTKGWDERMLDAMPKDCIGAVHCADGWGNNFNHFMFHQRWVSLTGLFPRELERFGPDGYVGKIAVALKRKFFLEDVVIEHNHFKNNKAKPDETYMEMRNNGTADRDHKRMKSYDARIQKEIELLKQYCS